MEFEIECELSERLQREALRQLFFAEYLRRKWVVIVLLWLGALLSVLPGAVIGFILTGVLAALAFALSWAWAKNYNALQRQGREYVQALGGPTLRIQFQDTKILIVGERSRQEIERAQVDRVVGTKDFLIPFVGARPVVCLPRSERLVAAFESCIS